MTELMPQEVIEDRIFLIRGRKIMLDRDLANLYETPTSVLNQAVKRNKERFPGDFMFSLTRREILKISQFVISSHDPKIKALKYSKNVNAFTEQGVAMLSSVLRSKRAIQVNIAIMRTFVRIRRILYTHKRIAQKLKELEEKYEKHDSAIQKNNAEIQSVFKAIRQLMAPPPAPKKKIGFLTDA